MAKAPTTLTRVRQLLEDLFTADGAPREIKTGHDGRSWALVTSDAHGTWVLDETWTLTWHCDGDLTVEPEYEYWVDSDLKLTAIAEDVRNVMVEFTHNTFPADEQPAHRGD